MNSDKIMVFVMLGAIVLLVLASMYQRYVTVPRILRQRDEQHARAEQAVRDAQAMREKIAGQWPEIEELRNRR